MADWRAQLLTKLEAPQSASNLAALAAWAQSEGMPAAANNPLAAEDAITGAVPTPGFSAPSYPSVSAMVDLYYHKLTSLTYAGIGLALVAGDDMALVYKEINSSPWCSGCQGGHYPIVLYEELYGFQIVPPTPPSPHGTGPSLALPNNELTRAWMQLMRTLAIRGPASLRAQAHARARIKRAVR